jgi:nitroreductase
MSCLVQSLPEKTMQSTTPQVDAAITSRRSIRAFLPTPVPRDTVEAILDVAARAPSSANTQPWLVHVLAGTELEQFRDAVEGAFLAGVQETREYQSFTDPVFEPYLSRRREVGLGLYARLGIEKGDRERTGRQHARNFRFFDAPVGMICTIDRRLALGSWIDVGMFLQNIATTARGRGLDTCLQAAFASFPFTIRRLLGLPEEQAIICGIALGHADPDAVENGLETPRVPAREFATFRGFAT